MNFKRWALWVLLLAVVVGLSYGVFRALQARQTQQNNLLQNQKQKSESLIELNAKDVLTIQMQDLQHVLPLTGTLRAVNSAVVKARVAGELQALTVREGNSVRMGQELARIDPQEYEARLRQALQQADASKAQVDIAQRQLDNNRSLVDQGFISKTALDTSIANLNAAAATYQAAVATADVARKSLNDTVLKAPISGLVSQRFAQPGERVAMDGRILEILDLSSLEVEAPLSPGDALGVRIGQIARLQVEGLPEPVQAKVTRINPSTQAGSRSVLVYLKLESNIGPQEGLRQGLYVEGTVGATTQTTLAVPVEAVRTDKPAPYLQILEPLPTADTYRVKHLNVKLGERGQLLSQTHTPLKPTGLGWMVGVGESSANASSASTPAASPPGLTLQGQLALAGSAGLLREGTLVHLNR